MDDFLLFRAKFLRAAVTKAKANASSGLTPTAFIPAGLIAREAGLEYEPGWLDRAISYYEQHGYVETRRLSGIPEDVIAVKQLWPAFELLDNPKPVSDVSDIVTRDYAAVMQASYQAKSVEARQAVEAKVIERKQLDATSKAHNDVEESKLKRAWNGTVSVGKYVFEATIKAGFDAFIKHILGGI